MSEHRVLSHITPPSGGWQRLLARRDIRRTPAGFALPLAAAASLTAFLIVAVPQRQQLQIPWSGGRLVAQRSEGPGVHLPHGRATPLPSADPEVQIYWLENTEQQ
ncbi:MAG: hypothetical protein ABW278_14205 [Steroidobacteraceae bacterium]